MGKAENNGGNEMKLALPVNYPMHGGAYEGLDMAEVVGEVGPNRIGPDRYGYLEVLRTSGPRVGRHRGDSAHDGGTGHYLVVPIEAANAVMVAGSETARLFGQRTRHVWPKARAYR